MRTTTHTAGIRNTHALINERAYTQCDQYTHHDHSAESVHAAHIDYGHHVQSVHDNDTYARPAGPRQSLASSPPPHTRATYGKPYEIQFTNPRGRDVSLGPWDTGNY